MQRASVVLLSLLAALSIVVSVQAQANVQWASPTPTPTPTRSPTPTPEPKAFPCPKVVIQPQSGGIVRDGQSIAFIANIGGGDPQVQPTILWSLSGGNITEGQATRRIMVDTTGAGDLPDRELKAELWVGGYAPECVLQASASVKIIPKARKFGDLGELPAETVSFHMKTLAKFLSDTTDNVFIIGYAGRKSERGFALNWLRKLRGELTTAGVSPRRINAIDGGFREEPLFDFWIVPPGAEPPRPSPTIDRREIVYPPAARRP